MYLGGGGVLNLDILVDLVNGIILFVGYKYFIVMFVIFMFCEFLRFICYELK